MRTANRNHHRSDVSLERDRQACTPPRRSGRGDGAFKVAQRVVGQRTVLQVRGDLDSIHAPELGQAVQRALASTPQQLVIDLCQVPFVDCRGLSVLLNARRRVQRLGIEISLACDVPSTLRLLERMGLDRAFDVTEKRSEDQRRPARGSDRTDGKARAGSRAGDQGFKDVGELRPHLPDMPRAPGRIPGRPGPFGHAASAPLAPKR